MVQSGASNHRSIIAASVDTESYVPQDVRRWDKAFDKFIEVTKQTI